MNRTQKFIIALSLISTIIVTVALYNPSLAVAIGMSSAPIDEDLQYYEPEIDTILENNPEYQEHLNQLDSIQSLKDSSNMRR
jgi:hypothetical protein